jgi:hypothetical protein
MCDDRVAVVVVVDLFFFLACCSLGRCCFWVFLYEAACQAPEEKAS